VQSRTTRSQIPNQPTPGLLHWIGLLPLERPSTGPTPHPHIPPYIYPPTPSYWEAAIFKETDSSSPPSSILTALAAPHTVIIYQHPRLRRRTRLFSQRFSRADNRITSPFRSTYDLVETKHSDPSVRPFRRTSRQLTRRTVKTPFSPLCNVSACPGKLHPLSNSTRSHNQSASAISLRPSFLQASSKATSEASLT
jgi:hypothetical protein